MNVLVCCEESGVVRRAFQEAGHAAWSNDVLPARDGEDAYHLQMDCFEAIPLQAWDLIIMHPPCDYLAVSGNRWYGQGTKGYEKRLQAVKWTAALWKLAKAHAPRCALENPMSVIMPILARECDVQYVQPHQFGHKESKKTGLALYNLPRLTPTDPLKVPEKGTPEHREWQKVRRMGPSAAGKRDQSQTYRGIAEAMASQWGSLP